MILETVSSTALHLSLPFQPAARVLPSWEPRELLSRFDSEADLQMRHAEALDLLRAQGAHESEDLAVRVGAAWAQIHHADLSHLLGDGLAWVVRSRWIVAQLEALPEASEDPFAAYALARWHAAAGRIRFRYGDSNAACLELTAAAKHAQRRDLWFCRPDILSHLLRARMDEPLAVGPTDAIRIAVRRFSTLREVMNRLAGRHGIDLGAVHGLSGELSLHLASGGKGLLGVSREQLASVIGVCDARESRRRCEMLRGLVSVHLNRALLFAPNPRQGWAGEPERSRDLGWWCARVAFAVGDRHRLQQALRHLHTLAT